MPWQRQVADVALELDEDGHLCYREVGVTVPRQSGKTTLVLAKKSDRCLNWGPLQQTVYSAQTGRDARKKMTEEWAQKLKYSRLSSAIEKITGGIGNEAIVWKNGSRFDVMASGEASGHGMVIDDADIDEAFKDADNRREQAIVPAMSTRRDAQLWVVSTAGTVASTYLRRKVEAGRAAASEDTGRGICYFEWSLADDQDPTDESLWPTFMPALGHTITIDVVRHAQATMTEDEFRRAFCNQWTESSDRIIPDALWRGVQSSGASPSGSLAIGVDVLPDRSAASVVVADADARIEVVEHRPGVAWVADRVAEMAERSGARVTFDKNGPAGSLGLDDTHALGSVDVLTACAEFFDAAVAGRLAVRPDVVLDAAVAGAVKKVVGDRWCWSRTASAHDVTPLYGATLAVAVAKLDAEQGAPSMYVFTS